MTESSESEILATVCPMNLQQQANAKAAMAYNAADTEFGKNSTLRFFKVSQRSAFLSSTIKMRMKRSPLAAYSREQEP